MYVYHTPTFYIYYIFGTNFVFWNFAKSQTQMFSLVSLWYLITECIRNALVWEERVLYGVPQSRWLDQQAHCLSHVWLHCSITFGLLESSSVSQPRRRPAAHRASLKADWQEWYSSHQCATNAWIKCRNRHFYKGQNLLLYVLFLSLHCIIL